MAMASPSASSGGAFCCGAFRGSDGDVTPSTDEVIIVQGPPPDRLRNQEVAVAVPADSATAAAVIRPGPATTPRQRFAESFILGPVWLAARGLWYLFVVAAIAELIGLVTAGSALRRILAGTAGGPALLILGIAMVLLLRTAFA